MLWVMKELLIVYLQIAKLFAQIQLSYFPCSDVYSFERTLC